MDFKELIYFKTLIDQDSMTQAAEMLGISQSTLSKSLSNTERGLGTKLVEYIDRHYVLSYAGQQYYDIATKILSLHKELTNCIADISKNERGKISIGMTFARAEHYMPTIIPEFQKKYPGIQLECREDTISNLIKMLELGDLQAVYHTTEREVGETFLNTSNFSCTRLFEEEIVLILPKDIAKQTPTQNKSKFKFPWVDIRDLANERFILNPTTTKLGRVAISAFNKYGISPANIIVPDTLTAFRLSEKGYGICFRPSFDYSRRKQDCSNICYRSFGETPIIRDFVVDYRNDIYKSEPMQFLQELFEKVK